MALACALLIPSRCCVLALRCTVSVLQGAFCPCILFGKNVEKIKPEIPWKTAAICHGVLVEGGVCLAITLAAAPSLVDPSTMCFLGELLVYSWWVCGLYTGLFRQELQHKYHLKVCRKGCM